MVVKSNMGRPKTFTNPTMNWGNSRGGGNGLAQLKI